MRCPETRTHWRTLNMQRRLLWNRNERDGRGGNRCGWETEHTRGFGSYNHRRSVIIGAYAFPLINSWCARIFNRELGVIAPPARIPPQDLRISRSSCSSRWRCFPSPPPHHVGTDMPDRRFCWNFGLLNEPADDLMEARVSKPECRNMDACLRRLKQELVRAVYCCPYHQLSTIAALLTWSNHQRAVEWDI